MRAPIHRPCGLRHSPDIPCRIARNEQRVKERREARQAAVAAGSVKKGDCSETVTDAASGAVRPCKGKPIWTVTKPDGSAFVVCASHVLHFSKMADHLVERIKPLSPIGDTKP